MKVYSYNKGTGEYIGEEEAPRDPLEKEERYLIPASATTIKPSEAGENEVFTFDGEKWIKKVDLRGKTYWNKETKEKFVIGEIGIEQPSDYVDEEPPSQETYIVWDGNNWVIDEIIKLHI